MEKDARKTIYRPVPEPPGRRAIERSRLIGWFLILVPVLLAWLDPIAAVVAAGPVIAWNQQAWQRWVAFDQELQALHRKVRREGGLPTWIEVYEQVDELRAQGFVTLEFDARFADAMVTCGTWNMENVVWTAAAGESVRFDKGALIEELHSIKEEPNYPHCISCYAKMPEDVTGWFVDRGNYICPDCDDFYAPEVR